jgi:Asp-tRNA(Asn)/Glu-tRNA(Gln) amidotransferase A subunit family amidase
VVIVPSVLLDQLATGRLSAVEAVDRALTRIEANDLGAWLALDADGARRHAQAADMLRAGGERGALLGAPVAVKDVIDAAGWPTTAGSDGWARVPETDATVVARVRAAGGIVLGKTATNEFAFGIDGTNPHHPPCRHPRDPDRLPGGSSAGSTVAVAAGHAAVAIGTDTSGSLRVPAALCGVLALRPTPGRVPRDGAVPLAPTYDVVGPIAATAADLALTFATLAGEPPVAPPPHPPARGATVEALLGPDMCHPDVAEVLRAAIARLGLNVEPVELDIADAATVHHDIQVPEGDRSLDALGVDRSRLSDVVRQRAASARQITQAARDRAAARRGEIAGDLAFAIAQHDVLLAPAAPIVAPLRDRDTVDLGGGRTKAVREALLSCAVPFAQGPFPAISVPAGEVDGLPVGLQIVGAPGSDEMLIALAGRLLEA